MDVVDLIKSVHSEDIKHKGYLESLQADLESITTSADLETKLYTRAEALILLKQGAVKADLVLKYLHKVCDSRDSIIKENIELRKRLKN